MLKRSFGSSSIDILQENDRETGRKEGRKREEEDGLTGKCSSDDDEKEEQEAGPGEVVDTRDEACINEERGPSALSTPIVAPQPCPARTCPISQCLAKNARHAF